MPSLQSDIRRYVDISSKHIVCCMDTSCIFQIQKLSSPGPKLFFQVCDLCSLTLLAKTTNASIVSVLPASLFSKVWKTPAPELKPRSDPGCGPCSWNLLAKRSNFILGAVLLSCLVFKHHKPSSLIQKPRQFFRVATFVSVIFSSKKQLWPQDS